MATKISLKQLSQEVLDLIAAGGGGALSKQIVSNVTVGAAAAGSVFPKDQTLTQFAEQILRKDITPTIQTSFSGTGIKEIGTQINGTTMALTITNLNSVTVPIDKIEFFVNNSVVSSQPYINGQKNYSFVYSSPIVEDTAVKAILTYNGTSITQGAGSFTFVYGSFYGVTKASLIDSTTMNGLIATFNKSIKNTKAFTWNNITLNDERFCYAYPAALGVLSSIKDGNGFSNFEGYTRYQVDITYPTNNKTVSYYVYLLNEPATGAGFTQIYS